MPRGCDTEGYKDPAAGQTLSLDSLLNEVGALTPGPKLLGAPCPGLLVAAGFRSSVLVGSCCDKRVQQSFWRIGREQNRTGNQCSVEILECLCEAEPGSGLQGKGSSRLCL